MVPLFIEQRITKALPLLFLGILLLGCGAGYLRDYPSKTLQEEAIKKTLIAFETAWNQHNEQALLALLDHDFILWAWIGANRRIVFRKGTFGFKLRDIFMRWRYLSLGSPDISIRDNEATVSTALTIDGRSYHSAFRLIFKEDRWLLLELEL
jgi:hypothetical protein